jgi:hypothetical protein
LNRSFPEWKAAHEGIVGKRDMSRVQIVEVMHRQETRGILLIFPSSVTVATAWLVEAVRKQDFRFDSSFEGGGCRRMLAHAHQRRKMNHLLEVASLVTAATDGREPDAAVAALLYDAVEDQGISTEQIADQFGSRVAAIVTEVTEDKSLPKAERKRPQVETARKKSREAKLFKLADKTSNLRGITNTPQLSGHCSGGWNTFNGQPTWSKNFVARH